VFGGISRNGFIKTIEKLTLSRNKIEMVEFDFKKINNCYFFDKPIL